LSATADRRRSLQPLRTKNMKYTKSILIISIASLISSCRVANHGSFKALDKSGTPLEVNILVESSPAILLLEQGDLKKKIKSKTNSNGEFKFSYFIPEQTPWIYQIFGANKIQRQDIKLSYEGKNQEKYEFKFTVDPE